MRKHSQSFGIYLIFGAIIVVFAINFGPGSGGCQPGTTLNWAATVNGEAVRQQEFGLEYERALTSRRQGRASLSETERLTLRKQVIEQLVQARLVSQEAERLGLKATDDELLEYLAQTYRVNDVAYEAYEGWVRRTFQTTVAAFEQQARGDIVRRKLVSALQDNISVSDAELQADYFRERDRAMVGFVRFDPQQQIDVPEPKTAAVAAVLANDLERVRSAYDKEKYRYVTPMRVSARQILRALPRDASDADIARERGILLDLRTQIAGGADFAALAEQYSQDSHTAPHGGDLGLFKRGQLIQPLEEAAFALQPGDMVAEPVRSHLGLHLIKTENIEPPKERSFDEVKQEVAAALLRSEKQSTEAERQAQQLITQLKSGKTLEELTVAADDTTPGATKPVRRESAWIQKTGGDLVPSIGVSQPLHDAIFALASAGDVVAEPYLVGRSYVVVQITKRELPAVDRFEKDKDMLREYRRFVKANSVLQGWLDDLKRSADIRYNPGLFATSSEDQES